MVNPELTMLWVRSDQIGYGRYGESLAAALREMNVDLYDGLDVPDDPSSAQVNEGRRRKQTNVVAWISVPAHARGWYAGQHSVMSTMWEATWLPETFRENLHTFDQVIVPSAQNVELFGRYHPNVTMVPLGVDPGRWQYRKRTVPGREFRFLIGGSGPRKGTDLAFAAFQKVFAQPPKDGPVPILVMKNPRGEDYYGERVEMVTGHLSSAQEVDLYASAHCYVQPSRGEGFGLQPLQAIAQGLPTILTDAHGHEAFARLGRGISAKLTKAEYFMYGDAGEWWEPDFGELCEWMEYIYLHYESEADRARNASRAALREFTWKRTAEKFVDVIGLDRLTTPYSGSGLWFRPEAKRYLIRVLRHWRADVGGGTYIMEPGVDYWENADLKRVLFETGVLDPSCIGLTDTTVGGIPVDTGLTESELARVGAYTHDRSYCASCGQRYGSGRTRADDIEAELDKADACV